MAIRRAYTQPQQGSEGFARTKKVYGAATIPILAADLTTAGNQVACFVVPKDFVTQTITFTVPDMDTGTTLTLSVGDSASSTRFVNASTAGQAGGTVSAFAAGGQYYQFPADTEILLTATTVGTTAGNVTNFWIEGFIM